MENNTSQIIIIIITLCEFFTPALADGLSLESKWQQVSSGLPDTSQYYGRFQQCCSQDRLDSSWFPILPFEDFSRCTNYNWYHRYPYVPQLFQFSGKV